MNKPFFKITNKSADTIVIDIEGDIGYDSYDWWTGEITKGTTKEQVAKLLKDVSNSAASQIIVNINSYGGDVNHGISIHDMLAAHKAKVTTNVNGMTASAATIIAQAGDVRKMSSNSLYLVHKASMLSWGNSNDIKEALSALDKVDGTIAGIYAKRSGKTADVMLEVMNRFDGRGEWLTAQEAVDLGLIDEVVEPMKAVASADPALFNRLGLPPVPENKIFNNAIEMKADKKTVFAWLEEFMNKIKNNPEPDTADPVDPPATDPVTDPVTDPETPPATDPEPGTGDPADPPVTTDAREVRIMDEAEVRTVMEDLTNQNTELQTQLQNALDEVSRLKGLPTNTKPVEDPFLDKSAIKNNEEAHEENARSLREAGK